MVAVLCQEASHQRIIKHNKDGEDYNRGGCQIVVYNNGSCASGRTGNSISTW